MKQTQLSYPTLPEPPPPPRAAFKTSAALPDAAPRTHTLRDGEMVFYKRKRSKVWQCKYKLFTGQWVRVSTGKSVLDVADRDFDAVLGRANLLLFRNAAGVRPRTFNGMFGKLMRESGLLSDAGGSLRTLYSLRHT